MPSSGRRVGPYVLGPEVGRGSSGVVYEASDEKLGRKVALKVLSDEVARTEELRARFGREARLLAAVRHANVAIVYGVVEEEGRVWLALEYLEGETLADVLARGPLSIEEALDVARQIADGLEAAHECGVVHRDLKPANVQRAPDGTVKVLDFGLAKPVREGISDSSELSTDGLVLGTPLYMSPEQLRGRPVDRRTDVWAFGCVLWELLTAERAFAGETAADVLHAILERDPDPSRLPARAPKRVRELVHRCLQKDPRKRLRDVGDARLELEAALDEREWARPSPTSAGAERWRPGWIGAGAIGIAAGLVGLWFGRPADGRSDALPRVLRIALDVPTGERQTIPRLTRDGSALIHEVAPDGDRERRHLVLRRLDAFEDVPIPGTDRVDTYTFSPDGTRLAVVAVSEGTSSRYELKTLPLDGSEPPRFLGALPETLSTDGMVAWLDDGRLVLSTRPRGLLLIDSGGSGRVDEVPVLVDVASWPHAPDVLEALPGTTKVLASSFHLGGRGVWQSIVVLDVETGEQTVVVDESRYACWLDSGHLLFSREDALYGAPFDLETLALAGDPVLLASGLRTPEVWISGLFHASREGTVAWLPGGVTGGERSISVIDGLAEPVPWSDDVLALQGFLAADPTGSFLTCVVVGPAGNYELWGSDVEHPRLRPVIADPRFDFFGGCVSLDRRELIVCRSGPEGVEVRRTSFDDPDEGDLVYRAPTAGSTFMSPVIVADGRMLTVYETAPDRKRFLAFDLSEPFPTEPRTVFDGPRSTNQFFASPDGHWLLIGDQDAPPAVRRIREDGSVGPPHVVPASDRAFQFAWWGRGQTAAGAHRLHLMPKDSRVVYEVEMREGPEGPEFSSPRRLLELKEDSIYDAEHLGGDRYLAILVDPDEDSWDSVHVMIGGLGDLTGD